MDMLVRPCNLPTSEYAVGIGWVLPTGAACKVCGARSVEGAPHPVDCDRFSQMQPTQD